jgi:AraC family transcriptional regulator, regulatory protein of adaptative response / DNA-3-methyladenine glycosylase II
MLAADRLDEDSAYRAIATHDARFDGRLFIGVTSTGVYCRPVCRVRTPMRRNCRFFANAASAEASGFRPCLRCRPELAPGLALVDSPQVLSAHAARMLDAAARDGIEVALPEVAAKLGVTDRHLRRIFAAAHGVTPIDYLTTQRLLLAKQLLTDTDLSVADIAFASGFGSQRRFNAAFAERYRLNPGALRRERAAPGVPRSAQLGPVLRLGYRPPYDVPGVVRFFADRCVAGVEAVARDAPSLRRTLAWDHRGRRIAGWLAARFLPERCEVEVAMSPGLAPAVGSVVQRVRQALDLDADPLPIDAALRSLPGVAGIRVPNGFCGWEIAVRVILGQQVTVAAARTLTARLVARFGTPIETPFADLTTLFPSAGQLAQASAEDIGKLGIVRQRVGALQALAREVHAGRIELHRGAPLASTLDALRALPGIGEWTVQLIAMRALAWPDAFPATDIGVMNALGTRDGKAVATQAEAWRPWRSYAVMKLWQTLETGR